MKMSIAPGAMIRWTSPCPSLTGPGRRMSSSTVMRGREMWSTLVDTFVASGLVREPL